MENAALWSEWWELSKHIKSKSIKLRFAFLYESSGKGEKIRTGNKHTHTLNCCSWSLLWKTVCIKSQLRIWLFKIYYVFVTLYFLTLLSARLAPFLNLFIYLKINGQQVIIKHFKTHCYKTIINTVVVCWDPAGSGVMALTPKLTIFQ